MIHSALIVETNLESGPNQQLTCLDRELKVTVRRILQVIERSRKAAEVVNRCR